MLHEVLENRRLLSGYILSGVASFDGTDGDHPRGGLIMDSAGDLFGVVANGGANNAGAVFEVAKASNSIIDLASFNGNFGEIPYGPLVMDTAGNLYGTSGGADASIFEVVAGSGVVATLAAFDTSDGQIPSAGLAIDSAGDLFGTTQKGGVTDNGTVYEVVQGSNAVTTLASFDKTDGIDPIGVPILDSAGNLYGITHAGGGNDGEGTVFEAPSGSGSITRLATFDGTNGGNPQGGLVMDSAGNLYGTAQVGADKTGSGEVFEVGRGSGIVTVLANFIGINGSDPTGLLTRDSSGNLFGTTAFGGANKFAKFGTAFEVFNGSDAITTVADLDGINGASPFGGLVIDSSGDLFGTAAAGGTAHVGAVFELSPNPAAQLVFTTLPDPAGVGANLVPPIAVSVEDASGNVVTTDDSSVTVAIASGPAGAALTGDVTVAAINGVATFDRTSLNRPGSYTLLAADGVLPTAASGSVTITSNGPPSSIVPTLGRIVLPASVAAGAAINAKATVAITNAGGALKGEYTVNLFLDTGAALDSGQVLISSASRTLTLGAGKHTAFNFTLKPLSPTFPPGAYLLLAQVIDPNGGENETTSSQTIEVIAPSVSLAAVVGAVVPSSLNNGQSGSVVVSVTNNGNISASGLLDLTLSPSSDGISPLPGGTLATLVVKGVIIAPGKSRTYTLKFKPTTLQPGPYSPYLSVSLGGVTTQTVGQQFMIAS